MEKQTVIKWLNGHITDETTLADKEIVDYLKRLVKADIKVDTIQSTKEWVQYFDRCWEKYPKKIGKAEAKKAFAKKVRGLQGEPLKEKAKEIFTKELMYCQYLINNDVEYQYCKHFASWINSEFENL